MRTVIKIQFQTALLLVIFSQASFAQESKPAINSLSWLAGCWELNVPQAKMTITEQWMKPAGGSMIGMSRTVKADKTQMFEFLRIVENADGIFYIARPSSAKEETSFKLVKSGPIKSDKAEAVFENLTHDFPQRIIYRSDKTDSVTARIESADAKKGMDIPMMRAQCQ